MREKKRIGFVGLGLMGSGMAGNLLAAGYPVVGYDVDRSRVEAFVARGGRPASSRRQSRRRWMRSSCRFPTLRW